MTVCRARVKGQSCTLTSLTLFYPCHNLWGSGGDICFCIKNNRVAVICFYVHQNQGQATQTSSTSTAGTTSSSTSSSSSQSTSQSSQDPNRQPISDEAFTQLVSGITGYMSQAAMGQAPRQTIADFLSNLGENYSIPQGESE